MRSSILVVIHPRRAVVLHVQSIREGPTLSGGDIYTPYIYIYL